jgi:predicted transcriptional regulator
MVRKKQQGELEGAVLDLLWKAKSPLTSGEILDILNHQDQLALTTVLTVLHRLIDKELVVRKSGRGRSHIYQAKLTKAEHLANLMLDLVAESRNPSLAFSHFASGLTPAQQDALRKSLNNL